MLNFNQLIEDFRPILNRTAGDGVVMRQRLEENLWNCRIDPVQAEMALLNIVTNAREAIGRQSGQGEVTISTRNMIQSGDSPEGPANLDAGEYVVVQVADTGPGLDPQIADKIFDPFFTTKEMGKGAGLGLAMVYGFMRQSGGLATVETDADGATIALYFSARCRRHRTPRHADTARTQRRGRAGADGRRSG